MTARYLLRLDDACHTMDRSRWAAMEGLLDRLGIKPIVAVVPDNRDPDLQVENPDPEFWDVVRRWQGKGWAIAMHGYQHVLHQTDARLILPFYGRGEFAGIPYQQQAAKIRASWDIFTSNGIEPAVWVAPAHCFDRDTLRAIRAETPIRIVSDGIARDQFFEDGFHWIPQQLWRLSNKRSGVWTVCLHPGTISDAGVDELERHLLDGFVERVTSLGQIALRNNGKSVADHAYDAFFWMRHRAMPYLVKAKGVLRG